MFSDKLSTERLFQRLTARPGTTLTLASLIIAAAAAGLPRLIKDTSVQAFIPAGHPALIADRKATEIFGLSDPIAVAVLSADGGSIFRPSQLTLVARLSERIAALPNVRADRVASLATESSISGTPEALHVDPYIATLPVTSADAANALERWQAMTPHQGTLVSEDGRAAAIMAELIDADQADATYQSVLALVSELAADDVTIHVAGPGAVSGFLSDYIDRDARTLQPLVFVLLLGFIYLAFRRASALPGPLLVVLGAAGGGLGLMAWAGVPYYAITNALPVILVAISVADAIHVLSAYYQLRAEDGSATARDLVVRAMALMARPITLTTLTTIAGFVGIGVVSIMPPITLFAWYAALGVALAWVFSLVALPNLLVLLAPAPSPAFANWTENRPSGLGRFLAHMGAFAATRHRLILSLFALATATALAGAAQLRIDRSQVDNFAPDEPIRIADELINETFAGTAFLDVVIETDEVDGLLDARRMARIAELQQFMEQLPHVRKTVAITDYLSVLHRALNQLPRDTANDRPLPEQDTAIAQYLLLYEASGDPTDFDEEIDFDYQRALLRGVLDAHYFSQNRDTVEALQDYLLEEFNEPGMNATLTGDVTVSYHWMSSLHRSHFQGVGLSLALVLATSAVVFKSLAVGVVAVVPVLFAVLILYGLMGYLGIYLEPATSMFAAIALGVGVDFAIHLVDRLRAALHEYDQDIDRAVDAALPPTARACFFNSAALGLGFSVLLTSDLPTLQRFGGLVTVAAFASYIAALVMVPALFAAGRALARRRSISRRQTAVGVALVALLAGSGALHAPPAAAGKTEALRIAEQVAARAEGEYTRRLIVIETGRQGRSRTRQRRALVLKQSTAKARFTRITYLAPKTYRDTAFLSHDFRAPQATDSRWFYAPADGRPRQVPAAERGAYFLGTDFTYEDIQSELKFDLADYDFEYRGLEQLDGGVRHRLAGAPKTARIARELGYGAFTALVDETSWMPVEVEFFDLKNRPLKTISVNAVESIDGIWTATDIAAVNHQKKSMTRFRLEQVSYPDQLPARIFENTGLARGLPRSLED